MPQVVARYVPPGHINLASFDTIGGGRVAEENWRYLGRYLRKKGFGVSAKEFRALSSAGNSKLHKGDIVLFLEKLRAFLEAEFGTPSALGATAPAGTYADEHGGGSSDAGGGGGGTTSAPPQVMRDAAASSVRSAPGGAYGTLNDGGEGSGGGGGSGGMRARASGGSTEWFYLDDQKEVRGPFLSHVMRSWYQAQMLPPNLLVRVRSLPSHRIM